MTTWLITPEKYLKEEEVQRIVKTCSDAAYLAEVKGNWLPIRDWMIIDLALNTGLRVQEVADLKVEDLHLEYNQSALTVQNGKGGKKRVVRYGSKLKAHLKKYLKQKLKSGPYLFSSSRGEKLTRTALLLIVKNCYKRSSLPSHYHFHSLRHTYATRLYKSSNNNLRLVQKQLGHSSVATTQVYSDVLDEDVEQALRKLEE
ncbi:MAG: phage integrase family protein [bacterium]|nr:phage integrase family protein [bacterium]